MPERQRSDVFPKAPAGDADRETFGNREFDDAHDQSAGELADEFTAYDYGYAVDKDVTPVDMSEMPTLDGPKRRTDKPSR